ncbi:phospholipase effector Tle1 domain-containing protein [Bradyrhizobium sp. McL0615]|uniref:phospholipase effector Tle1 domain-containing protein n=1 Tax=Bradyrhizobium sp. McL0615 TaxID=3415673 RepID=UPI003CF79A06
MPCGVPTKAADDGPLMRYRKAVKDIAWEAVDTVLEHGAGHPREEFEAERLELARRFQVKYGSGNGSDANAAAYFIGVFDTVAALGASGTRRLIIEAGLTAGVAAAAFIASLVPAAVIGTITAIVSDAGLLWGFIVPAWAVTHIAMMVAVVWFLKRSRTSNRKTIHDFPNKGDPPRSHEAVWSGKYFDRLLSKHVRFARSANAIDETRKDFDGVGWGGTEPAVHAPTPGVPRLVQMWFAGNHSDIGGSYPEPESRLSDAALKWMCEQALSVPDGLRTGPIFADGVKMPHSGDAGAALNIYPAADDVQHCEVAGMRDTLDALAAKLPKWGWLRRYIAAQNWETNIREVKHDAPLHPTVVARTGLARVTQCATVGPYRPVTLHDHDVFKPHPQDPGAELKPEIHGSPPLQSGLTTPAPGTSGS